MAGIATMPVIVRQLDRDEAVISMVDANVGDWAVVHAGFAIQIMDEEDAQETIRLWNEGLDSDATSYN